MTSSPPAEAPPAVGRHRLKKMLRPLAGGRAYGFLHGAAKAWDIRTGRWSEPELELLPRLVRPGETAIDVGANFGLWTWHLCRAVGPAGRVVAFEPVPSSLATLRRVARLLRLKNVEIHGRGLSDAAGEVTFVLPLQASGAVNAGLAHARGRGDDDDPNPHREVVCLLERLDDIAVHGDVSFLKCDIEGAELAALRGGERLLRQHSPTLILEVDPHLLARYGLTPQDVFGYLSGLGYGQPHRFEAGVLREARGADATGNLVFVHPRRAARLDSRER